VKNNWNDYENGDCTLEEIAALLTKAALSKGSQDNITAIIANLSFSAEPAHPTCPSGHALTSNLADENLCDKCEKEVEDGEVVMCCAECEYDMCTSCWRAKAAEQNPAVKLEPAHPTCPSDHALTSNLADENFCDKCEKGVEDGKVVMCCAECEYDMCTSCYGAKGSAKARVLEDPVTQAKLDPAPTVKEPAAKATTKAPASQTANNTASSSKTSPSSEPKEAYLASHVSPVLRGLLQQVIEERPTNILDFMISTLTTNRKS